MGRSKSAISSCSSRYRRARCLSAILVAVVGSRKPVRSGRQAARVRISCMRDRLRICFTATAPSRKWVADLTRIAATEFFSTTRAGYRAMLRWMRSHGDLARIGVECTGSYGAGRLRFVDNAGLEVLEVTAPDRSDRRRRGKDDTIDAGNAAHARSPRSEPSHRKPATEWSSRCGSYRSPARPPFRPLGLHSR